LQGENVHPKVKGLVQTSSVPIITSPLRRMLETTCSTLGFLIERGIKVIADPRIQGIYLLPSKVNRRALICIEISSQPCDTGSEISQSIKAEFSKFDFSLVEKDTYYPEKTGPYKSSQDAVEERIKNFFSEILD
jgi:hypothetical protein